MKSHPQWPLKVTSWSCASTGRAASFAMIYQFPVQGCAMRCGVFLGVLGGHLGIQIRSVSLPVSLQASWCLYPNMTPGALNHVLPFL